MIKVIVDVDGVLANYNAGIADIARDLYGIELPLHPRDITDWYQCSKMIGKERWVVVWDRVMRDPQFLSGLPPLATPNEFARLESLNLTSDLYFVTNRSVFGAKTITEQWLMGHGISAPTVVLSRHKGFAAAGIEADFVIDDSPQNVMDIYRDSPKTKIYLMSYPYNREVEYLATKCVNSFGEFLDDIYDYQEDQQIQRVA